MPPRVPSSTPATGPQPPKLTLLGPHLPTAMLEPSFSLELTLPLHPVALLTGAVAVPNHLPTSLWHIGQPHFWVLDLLELLFPQISLLLLVPFLFVAQVLHLLWFYQIWYQFPQVASYLYDEEELAIPSANEKGKGKEFVPGTDEDEHKFTGPASPLLTMDVDDEVDGSPPPTNIAHLVSVSELLGAPPIKKPKKGSPMKPKFDNPPPSTNDSTAEGMVKAL
ncbi:hypothetical protein IW261DRAFT_1422877 [Armillaria novae-zelandiae]|uniref:Uncharacterized protein n=1 Tax=Armillaria novae-zelandiae TaxID=153914 RepID=A0AA39TZY2_9AGAR|nr:hypothetical protein IW261DRAFT_1422877 [Armillaria novae-zelandiae]